MSLDVPFTPSGDLPAGVHRATLREVIARFGRQTPRRVLIGERLRRIHEVANQTSLVRRFVVFGSFVSATPAPNDVDIFLIMEDEFDASDLAGDALILFDHMAAQAYFGASVFWVRRVAALDGEDEAVAFWQMKRDGTKRGIVEVVTDDSE